MVRAALRPSPVLATVFVIVHLAAGATLFPLDLPPAAKLFLAAVITASLARTLWHHALLKGKRSIIEIEVTNQEHGAVRMRTGGWLDALVLGTSCVTPRLTVINLRVEGGRTPRHLLLVRDNVAPDDFRRIRVLLRWARPKIAEGGGTV
jgi:hypothetical protein